MMQKLSSGSVLRQGLTLLRCVIRKYKIVARILPDQNNRSLCSMGVPKIVPAFDEPYISTYRLRISIKRSVPALSDSLAIIDFLTVSIKNLKMVNVAYTGNYRMKTIINPIVIR